MGERSRWLRAGAALGSAASVPALALVFMVTVAVASATCGGAACACSCWPLGFAKFPFLAAAWQGLWSTALAASAGLASAARFALEPLPAAAALPWLPLCFCLAALGEVFVARLLAALLSAAAFGFLLAFSPLGRALSAAFPALENALGSCLHAPAAQHRTATHTAVRLFSPTEST